MENTPKEYLESFKKELRELLVKYNATIGFSVGESSDTHGLYGEKIEVTLKHSTKPHYRSFTLSEGWTVCKSDLE